MNGKWLLVGKAALTSLSIGAMLVGCSSNKESTTGEKAEEQLIQRKLEPVTIRMFNLAGTTEESFKIRIKAPVEKKYPHITMEFVPNAKGTTLVDLAAANNLPDIVYGKTSDQDLMMDLAPLIKQYKFDVTSIKPELWSSFVYLTSTEKKMFIPYQTNGHLLHVNKGIFDRFGVAYPKDGMTWDETFELAKKVARTDGGVEYFGFNVRANLNIPQSQIVLPYIDANDKAAVTTDAWKKYFTNLARFFEIPGNQMKRADGQLSNDDLFTKKQQVAMYASHPITIILAESVEKGNDINWDIVSLPTFPESPRTGSAPNTNGMGITQVSKHKDDAFLAIQVLVSEETQTMLSRLASPSVMTKDENTIKDFGKDVPGFAGKNMAAYFYNKYALSRNLNIYNTKVANEPNNAFSKVVYGEQDVNTALREAEDAMNKIIAEEKALQKN